MKKLKYILFPFAWCYWLFTFLRNKCFDWGLLSQTQFAIPTISVGNITVGGTGKTPHVQYIIQLLQHKRIASLSRGYKRKSKGFVLANAQTSVQELGDEPYQLQQRFPNIHVAVCEKRVEGVEKLQKQIPNLQAIILDDAYQHRYIKPQFQILLIDYNRPLWNDHVFPVGYMREGHYAVNRADVVIVTKCPSNITITEQEQCKEKLHAQGKKIFFTTMHYESIYHFKTKQLVNNQLFIKERNICVITGIAQPRPMVQYLQSIQAQFISKTYPDHYSYSEQDKRTLQELAKNYTLLTTEKDVYKLSQVLPDCDLYVLPIMPQFCNEKDKDEFDELIQAQLK